MGQMCVIMLIVSLLFLAVLVAGLVSLARTVRRTGGVGGGGARPASGALAILEERFAAGEIDTQEFELRRRMITG